MSNLLSIYNTFESQRRQDRQRQEEQQSQQDRLLSSQVLQRLDSFKDDPARYKAFRDGAIMAVPEVKGALERTFTPQGLKTIIDDSTLESPEERLQRKTQEHMVVTLAQKRAEAAADADPKLNQIIKLGKATKQIMEDDLALNPEHLEKQRILAERKALDTQSIEAKKTTTSAYKILENANIEKERTEKWNPNFKGLYASLAPQAMAAVGDDKKIDEWMTLEGRNTNRENNRTPSQELVFNYHKARLLPVGTKIPSIYGAVSEDQYKQNDYEMAMGLLTGYVEDQTGKRISVDTKNSLGVTYREKFIDQLLVNPLVDGPSPYYLTILPTLSKQKSGEFNENWKKTREQMIKRLKSMQAVGTFYPEK